MTSANSNAGLIGFFAALKGVIMSFLTSFAVIFLCALLFGKIACLLKLPPLLGMLIVGIVLGPCALNLISPDILNISADLRQAALIVILTRAGLSILITAPLGAFATDLSFKHLLSKSDIDNKPA